MATARLVSVNVGAPIDVAWRGQTVRTAIFKTPVAGRRPVSRLNVEGDAQADLVGHGGEHRAVFAYQLSSYEHWERVLGRRDLRFGQFGENFTVAGLDDDEVCIGDRLAIGDALFEVTQPRVTCFKVGIRLAEPRMPSLLVGHGRPGFYLRVLREGQVGAGDEIVRVAEGPARVTVREASALLYLPGHDPERLRRALSVPALSEGWRASFQALLEQEDGTGNAGLGRSTPPPAWTGFRPFRVESATDETASVRSLALAPADGGTVSWIPGQFVTLRLSTGDGLPLVRSYSISRAPGTGPLRISVKREPGGRAGAHLHEAVRPGDELDVAAPRGAFTLEPTPRPLALLSAGIGVTPVLAMLEQLVREHSTRELLWFHAARTPAEHAFAADARELLSALPGARAVVHYSRVPGATRLDPARLELRADAAVYVCGPPSFLRDVTDAATAAGVAAERVHVEAFGGTVPTSGGRPHPPPGPPRSGPAVTFARSGLEVGWDGAYGSLLELAEACDVAAPWSCRTGVCRTCETGLVDGTVSYDPVPLEPAADGHALLCCARPDGPVTIDL